MKILLAIDNSKFSEAALRMVVAQNRPQDTAVRVLHVVEPLAFVVPPEMAAGYTPTPELMELRKDQFKQSQELAAKEAGKLRDAGFQVETDVHEGDTREEIIDVAAEWHADLIVVGSQGRKGLDRFMLGSVSEFVARHARCSVEIVRLPPTGERPAS